VRTAGIVSADLGTYGGMYHIELRQFPHNMCHFNMTERELLDTVVVAWAREQWIELGDRKWNPHQSKLKVLEGPEIPIEQLSMGRGWPTAQRLGKDVTERVVAQAKQADAKQAEGKQADEAPAMAGGAATGPPAPRDAPDATLLPLLGDDPAALLQAWRLAAERRPELMPSEALALAEQTLSSLDKSPR
jgi:hypothetical protein